MTLAKKRETNVIDTTAPTARIMVVDDHPIVRHGLVQLIEDSPRFTVCAQTDNAAEAMQLIHANLPDLVVVDISLKDTNGIELIKQVRAQYEDIRMLVSSMHDEGIYAERALQAGAMGYINKEQATDYILTAIEQILAGRIYISTAMTERFLRRAANGSKVEADVPAVDRLSDRELEVYELIGKGITIRQIADKLHLSPKTIETYRQHIKTKLGLANSSELAVHAAEWVLKH